MVSPVMPQDVALAGEPGQAAPAQTLSRPRRAWILFLISCVGFLYMLDRNAVTITQELIKQEFGLTDTQVGVLVGAAYGISYALAGLPIGWLIDRGNRVRVLASVVAAWSLLTGLCGLATGYLQLLLARIGIGAAESGGQPAAFSILADMYPPDRRASATSMYLAAAAAGSVMAAFAGGYVAAAYGWRAVFVLYGVPGLVVAALILFTIREPVRTSATGEAVVADPTPFPIQAWRILTDRRLWLIYAALGITSIVSNGVNSWQLSYLMRVHRWDIEFVGLIGGAAGLASIVGMIAFGWAGDRSRLHSPGGPARVVAASVVINLLSTFAWLYFDSPAFVIVGLVFTMFTGGAYAGCSYSIISEVAPAQSRGLAFSVGVVTTNLVGAAFGPTIIGILSDFASANMPGSVPLRFALTGVVLLQIPCLLLYLASARRLDRWNPATDAVPDADPAMTPA